MLRLITTQSVDKWLSNTILSTPRFMNHCRKNVRNKKDVEEAVSRVEHSSEHGIPVFLLLSKQLKSLAEDL